MKNGKIEDSDIIKYSISQGIVLECMEYSKYLPQEGHSQFRAHGEERDKTKYLDSLTGHIGNYIGCYHFLGSSDPFRQSRCVANKNPYQGDNGSDIIGSNCDFKTSIMRKSVNPMDYHLIVRPKERHDNNLYVRILLEPIINNQTTAYISGWATDDMLPINPEPSGPLSGAFVLTVGDLYPVPKIVWNYY